MSLLVSFLLAVVVAAAAWAWFGRLLAGPAFARLGPDGRPVPAAGGVVVLTAHVLVNGFFALLLVLERSVDTDAQVSRGANLTLSLGLGLFGLVADQLGPDPTTRSGRGSDGTRRRADGLRAALRGRPSADLLVGVTAFALALIASLFTRRVSVGQLLADATLIALASVVAARFDGAPARVAKVAGVAGLVLAVTTRGSSWLGGVATVAGGVVALVPTELRAQVLLGRAGASVVGGSLGLGLVLTAAVEVRAGVLAALVLAVATLTRERIDAAFRHVRVLAALDRLGRRPAR